MTNSGILADMQRSPWAMDSKALTSLLQRIAEANLDPAGEAARAQIDLGQVKPRTLKVVEGTAIIPVRGVLMDSVPWFFDFLGITSTAYGDIAANLSDALGDESVESILLDMDSPGGSSSGVAEVGDAIFAARTEKPLATHIVNLCASAAYWLASQTQTITANPMAEVGSIGAYKTFVDSTKAHEKEGIKVHVVRSGSLKGMGLMGVAISDEQLASAQAVIDGMADIFNGAVARGRGMKKTAVRVLATGGTWIAKDAKDLGLLDGVETINTALAGVRSATDMNSKGAIMTEKEQAEALKAAEAQAKADTMAAEKTRFAGLKEAFPKDLDFAVEQYEAGASVPEAKAAFSDVLATRMETLEAENAKLKKTEKKTPTPAKGKGAAPLPAGDEDDTDQDMDFMAVSKKLAQKEGLSMTAAMKRTNMAHPELHQAFLHRARQGPEVEVRPTS